MLAPGKDRNWDSPAAAHQELQSQPKAVDFTFDVSVDDHVAVQVGHPLQDLPGVAPRHVFRQRSVRLQLVLNGALGENVRKGGNSLISFSRSQVNSRRHHGDNAASPVNL